MDDDDDDDMGSPPLEDSMQRQNSLPPHLQNQSYMRAGASASPPVSNGIYQSQRQSTPQAQMISRPGSRNTVRRSSMNLGPSHLQQVTQAPSGPNGYAYMRNPPPSNYQAGHAISQAPHPANPTQQPSFYNRLPQHATHPQVHHAYMQEHKRQSSMPPSYQQHERPAQQPPPQPQPQQQQQAHIPSPPQPKQGHRVPDDQRMQNPAASKSRSIFTPIDDSRSLLAQHWGIGKTTTEPKEVKREKEQSQFASIENVPPQQQASKPASPPRAKPQGEMPGPRRTNSTQEFAPPSRTNSAQLGAKRPKLKVHIPEEQSDTGGAATGESSKEQSGGTATDIPAKGSNHSSGTGVVLPPPSPSASAILSAGAQGPPNPFARPHPPMATSQQSNQPSNNERNNSIDTPISALPSRFVADGLLPSPSSFYPEWAFGRSGGESANILPSPLNFQTPVTNGGPSFGREDEGDKKRKSPEREQGLEPANMKRVKT